MDGRNREETVKLLLPENKGSKDRTEEMYEGQISSRFGFTPPRMLSLSAVREIQGCVRGRVLLWRGRIWGGLRCQSHGTPLDK